MKTVVKLAKLAEALKLQNLTPEIDMEKIELTTKDINRPALQLAGYYDHFSSERVQIIGYVEYSYIMQMEREERQERFEKFISSGIPCVIFTTLTEPTGQMIETALKYKVPLLVTSRTTSSFMAEIIRWLGLELAPSLSIHGVLVDVYGEGVLIMGESGIGKSEAALELVRRGIGIIDVRMLYGVEHVKDSQEIDLVIKLEDWNKEKEYDRLGLVDEYTEILGNKVVQHSLPIRPGRNLAVIVETAAVNHRQKKMGNNAVHELNRRVQENMIKKRGN